MRALAALRGLAANLVAGARLAAFMPVARTAFRIDAAQLLLAAVVSALVDAGADWVRRPPAAMFDIAAGGAELASLALLVAIAAFASWLFRDPPALIALPVVVLVSLPLVQLANLVPWALAHRDETAGPIAEAASWLVLGWFIAVLARCALVALQPALRRAWRVLLTTALLASPLVLPPGVIPENAWWSTGAVTPDMDATNPASEAVLALQRQLQDEALAGLSDHGQGETQLYFIGFAPDGDGATWRARLDKARSVMDVHWGTVGRSLSYVNDPASLTESPMATVSFLREALEEIASAANPDEDILMLYVAGRSNLDGSLRVHLPPLGLVQLSAAGLAYLLRDAGITWKVVVVAVCDPAPFVEALADDTTLVIASPGCPDGGPPTTLGDTLFGETLASATSLPGALQEAHRRLAARGAAPTIRMGDAIAAQLARLKSAPGGRAAREGARAG
jgi:hypothetical protein